MRLLLVEDHASLSAATAQGLREAGYAVDVCADGEQGLAYAQQSPYDVLILDWMLPKQDGMAVLRSLRQAGSSTPVLMLTARGGVAERVQGLDAGADDYLIKPFALAELLARVRALVRRRYEPGQALIRIADLELETTTRRVRRGDREIALSAREFALLEYLAMRRGQVVSRSEMLQHVYDFASDIESNVLDVYISLLRKKLDRDAAVKLIHTHRGLGYSLDDRP